MKNRKLGQFQVSEIGLGCMNLSHAYGAPVSEAQAEKVLLTALDAGVTFFDTAALYGFGANETLVGKVLKSHRQKFTLASKCGMTGVDVNGDGKLVRVIDGRPETIRKTCEDALKRLQTDVIDLYYLHRWDKKIPIEDSVGALSDLVRQGKIQSIGLSEVSASTLRKAHAVHPITAVQTEYSLWTRNPEIAVLKLARNWAPPLWPSVRWPAASCVVPWTFKLWMPKTFANRCRVSHPKIMLPISNCLRLMCNWPTRHRVRQPNWPWLGCSTKRRTSFLSLVPPVNSIC